MLFNYLSLIALALSAGVAFKWGGLDERIASTSFIFATLASKLLTHSDYGSTELMVLAVDSLLLIALVILALRSDRFWPMWAAGFQLVGTSVHFASMTETGDFAWAYAVGLLFWSYPVMLALGVGTWLEGRHRRSASFA